MAAELIHTTPASFTVAASTLAGWPDPGIAIAASRAGAVGVLNLVHVSDLASARRAVERLARYGTGALAVKLAAEELALADDILSRLPDQVQQIVVTATAPEALAQVVAQARDRGRPVWLEVTSAAEADLGRACDAAGLIAKGNEAGGVVGDETTFILLQRVLARSNLPVWALGGIGRHSAAACLAAGARGVVLESQLALTPEAGLPDAVRQILEGIDGDETVCVSGDGAGQRRVYRPVRAALIEARPRTPAGAAPAPERSPGRAFDDTVKTPVGWGRPDETVWPLGQDAAFAASLTREHKNVAGIVRAIRAACDTHVASAKEARVLAPGSPLAASHGTRYPIVQGPMTRVSDTAAFADAIAEGGGLPFLALALMRGPDVRALLEATEQRLGTRPWGIGILGFVPPELRQEQLDATRHVQPPFALIAGGRPDQALALEQRGIATYLHVPAPVLLHLFLDLGARRFVFEGRECGGHVGPRSSFVLWETMVEVLLAAIHGERSRQPQHGNGGPTLPGSPRGQPAWGGLPGSPRGQPARGGSRSGASRVVPEDLHVLFAGGIHDARSAAMVQAIAAPLAAAGVRIGILMGSAYLFTEEAVTSGAILQGFQDEAIRCRRTVLLESGPGHATRCAETPFSEAFRTAKRTLVAEGRSTEQIRDALERLNVGRLRVASKGLTRATETTGNAERRYVSVEADQQRRDGMYMLGQLAALREGTCRVADLHEAVSIGSTAWLDAVSVSPPLAGSGLADSGLPGRAPGTQPPCDVAIVGMGCLVPGAPNVETFWHNILAKVDAITEVPADRFDVDQYFHTDRHAPDKIYSRWGGFLDEVPFDPLRYGIPPSALPSIDPVQLLTLEVVRQALDDAGGVDDERTRDRTSVILGAGGGLGDLGLQYGVRATLPMMAPGVTNGAQSAEMLQRLPPWTEDSFPGILLNVIAGRVANRFNFGGVNFTVDAACASSLTAIYLAVRELTTGSSDVAIAGGVDTVQSPFGYLCFSKTQALSPRGRCRAFDASADGIAISEGLAVVVLKRLADAERDGDRIYAVIKGVAGSSDGRDKSLTAPRPQGQMRVLERAYAEAGCSASSVGLIEAHGTGTVVGDAAEVESLTRVFRSAGAGARHCALGSIKSMIGHTKSAAGVAGLMKVALALYHKVLPPTLHVERPNPALEDPESPFFITTEAMLWVARADGAPRRAGVSAFGFGGTNAHAVLEEYTGDFRDTTARLGSTRWPAELFLWEAESAAALASTLASTLPQDQSLGRSPDLSLGDLAAAVCRATTMRRGSARHAGMRLAIVASSLDDLGAKLARARQELLSHPERPHLVDPRGIHLRSATGASGRLAFLFSGQGSQRPHMLRDLAIGFGDLRESVERAERVLGDLLPRPLSTYLYPPPAFGAEAREQQRAAITDTQIAQPALGAVEVGAVALLARLGIRPDMTAGHSYGEYVALWAAGVIGEAALFEISERRGRAIKESLGDRPGTMAAVHASAEEIARAADLPPGAWLANFNAPRQTVIAGETTSVEALTARLRAAGLESQPIPVACAFHSPLMEASQRRLGEALSTLSWQRPEIPVFSNSLGAVYPDDPAEIRRLLAEHLVRPVRFVDEIAAMYDAGARIFLEVGPGTTLAGLARQTLAARDVVVLSLDGSGGHGLVHLLHTLGQLAACGVPIDVEPLFHDRVTERLDLHRLPENKSTQKKGPEKGSARGRAAGRWLVNGGRARPADGTDGGPTRPRAHAQMDVRPQSTEAPVSHEVLGVTKTRTTPDSGPAPRIPPRISARRPPQGGEDEVLIEFQHVMRQFLQTQAAVMTSFLEGRPAAGALSDEVAPEDDATVESAAEEVAGAGMAGEVTAVPILAQPSPVAVREPQPVPEPMHAQGPPNGSALDRLLQIVSDRTGYPTDMLDVDSDIEADLGIDSIKRVEILTTFQRESSPGEQTRLQGLMDQLARLRTLREVSQALDGSNDDAEPPPTSRTHRPAPHDVEAYADHRSETAAEDVPRVTVATVDAPLAGGGAACSPGRVSVITDDGGGVAAEVARALRAGGEQPILLRPGRCAAAIDAGVYEADVAHPGSVAEVLDVIVRDYGPIDGLLHLLPLTPCPPLDALTLESWRVRLGRDIKGLYALVRASRLDLERAGSTGRGFVMAATGMGGSLGTGVSASRQPTHAGVAAAIKTLALELPVRCRTIDLDPAESPSVLASRLIEEIVSDDRTAEVGYQGGRRVTVVPRLTPLTARDQALVPPIDAESVVLLTGGARGITADIAAALAHRFRPTLILVGRAPEPSDDEPRETAGIEDPRALQAALTAALRQQHPRVTPAEVQRACRALSDRREIARTLARLRQAGSRVRYHQVDVRDEVAVTGLIDHIYDQYGRLDVVVHGAGVIEDRLIGDKTPESFDRVLHTKADSVFLLARALRPETLKVFALMSSVTATFGNRGQVDYAAANGILNGFAARLSAEWPGQVVALNWGPWDGRGMASPEVRAQFLARGVVPIPASAGTDAAIRELAQAPRGHAIVVFGEGPWLHERAAREALHPVSHPSPAAGLGTPVEKSA